MISNFSDWLLFYHYISHSPWKWCHDMETSIFLLIFTCLCLPKKNNHCFSYGFANITSSLMTYLEQNIQSIIFQMEKLLFSQVNTLHSGSWIQAYKPTVKLSVASSALVTCHNFYLFIFCLRRWERSSIFLILVQIPQDCPLIIYGSTP